jgi:hypothetical protein
MSAVLPMADEALVAERDTLLPLTPAPASSDRLFIKYTAARPAVTKTPCRLWTECFSEEDERLEYKD